MVTFDVLREIYAHNMPVDKEFKQTIYVIVFIVFINKIDNNKWNWEFNDKRNWELNENWEFND